MLSTWILKIVVKQCLNEIDSVLRYDYMYDETLIAIRHVQFFIDLFFMQKIHILKGELSECNIKKTEENYKGKMKVNWLGLYSPCVKNNTLKE